jgi:hypothetical protein
MVDIPGKLVQHDNLGQPTGCRFTPAKQFGQCSLFQQFAKTLAYQLVEISILLPSGFGACFFEPELEYLFVHESDVLIDQQGIATDFLDAEFFVESFLGIDIFDRIFDCQADRESSQAHSSLLKISHDCVSAIPCAPPISNQTKLHSPRTP